MTIAVGAHCHGTGNTDQLALPSVTTAASGSTFVIFQSIQDTGTLRAPIDNKSNTYTRIGSAVLDSTAGNQATVWYCQNGTGGAGHIAQTKTATGGIGFHQTGWFVEITGGATSSILDQAPAGNDDTASPFTTTTTGTTTQSAEIALAYFATNGTVVAETLTWANGFTQIDAAVQLDNAYCGGGTGYKVLSTTGTVQGSITVASGNTTEAIGFIATFIQAPPPLGIDEEPWNPMEAQTNPLTISVW